ncbi:MAG: DNA polymerase III subunit beta [Candidatus Omnitrophica bacterium CG08_land_8_20_14_0_20_41_16]|uniref:Beta sliding clamp n=1 Tax=Candidatus Sherwoodlollariibacterium unditelluris TaxID=1974757 RepID=A0A2G9YKG5_9BACT|nr:MAG: DNA polymerase III subunit beta [Candidatus Omnitrophica bacterium CG23_combo_of_CG06-09_8_20_14_all_41_10]PIS33443.1 MAG: DNA polymerase III subunit beta [Candidatus Omnitrophica bacterium CG08_land_8_20_14_0_20_41_16]
MKLKVEKNTLLNGIQIVQNVIIAKATLPILSNILIETQQDSLRLTATDLDIGITCLVPVDIQEAGAVTVPAKRFSDIVKELPEGEINITTKKNNQVNIETGLCQFKIMGLAREEFPKLPEFKDKEVIKLEQAALKEALNLTSFSVSMDETRYILNGILFRLSKNNLTLVATDGKRLAIAEKKLNYNVNKDINIIVPIKTIHELNRNLKDDGELSLILGSNQVLFDLGGVMVISRLIEGEFPDYKQVIPPATENKMRVNRGEFLLAVKRAALLSTPDYQAIKLEVFKNKLVVSKSTPDVGESREEAVVEYQGKELAIGFNPNYLVDVLKNLSEEFVNLELVDSEKPGVIRINGYIYIVLPMRLS